MSGFAKTKKAVAAVPDGARKELLNNLIRKAEFMHEELLKLQDIIKKTGWVEEYQNGKDQHGFKKSSEGDTYNQLIKNYAMIIRQIIDNLPNPKEDGDEMTEYLKSMKTLRGQAE